MSRVILKIKEALERHDKWVERLYWKAILFESALWIAGYGAVSYLFLGQVDVTTLLVLTLIFPTGLVMLRARKSIRVGKVLYVSAGVALGLFLGSLGFLAALVMGVDVSFGTLIVAYTLGLPGAWLGYRWGKKKGFLAPGSSS